MEEGCGARMDVVQRIQNGKLDEAQVLSILKSLLDERQNGEVQYVRCCIAFEKSSLWLKGDFKHKTFPLYLKSHNLKWGQREDAIRRVVEDDTTEPMLSVLGVEACIWISQAKPKHRDALVRTYSEVVAEQGKFVQKSHAGQLFRRITGVPRTATRADTLKESLEQADRELIALRRELKAKKAEIAKLKVSLEVAHARIEQLEAENRKLRGRRPRESHL